MAPLTKLYLTFLLSFMALITNNLSLLLLIYFLEIISGSYFIKTKTFFLLALSLLGFSIFLILLQLLCGSTIQLALASGAKMAIMSTSLVMLLQTTTSRELTVSLVSQLHLPYKYAFMITAILRFVPELLQESKSILDAQACRGFSLPKNPVKRLFDYLLLVKPMIFRAITRSEHMALSLQLRGFSVEKPRQFILDVSFAKLDYLMFFISFIFTGIFFMVR